MDKLADGETRLWYAQKLLENGWSSNVLDIGVDLLDPSGFEVRLVYDVSTLDVVYRDTLIPGKSRREALRRESLSVADAVKLAASAAFPAK